MKIENRTFIISGGSSGLGLATAEALIKANAFVSILDLSPPPTHLTGVENSGSSERARYIRTDVTDIEGLKAAVTRTVAWTKETGAVLGGVVNCAGIARAERLVGRRGELPTSESWNKTIGINLMGTFNLTRLTLEHLVNVPPEEDSDGERGVIIMVSSIVAFDGHVGQTAYAASKGAIRSMVLPMARDLARHSIRVVAIAPGAFATPMTDVFPERAKALVTKSSIVFPKRFGLPREFAATVKWILDCQFVNGETIMLTGGSRVFSSL